MFDAPSRAFLEQWGLAGCALALDLGCGPGFTTELLRDALAPQRVVGVEASPAFVQVARGRAPGLAFVQHDVLDLPFPSGAPDLVYARFLVSHLSDPARGQCLYVGPRLDALAEGLAVASSAVREHPVDPRDAARMFALNLATLAPDERELAAALERIASDGGGAISWGLRQVVIQAG